MHQGQCVFIENAQSLLLLAESYGFGCMRAKNWARKELNQTEKKEEEGELESSDHNLQKPKPFFHKI